MIPENPDDEVVKALLEQMHCLVWRDSTMRVPMHWALYWNDDRERRYGVHWQRPDGEGFSEQE